MDEEKLTIGENGKVDMNDVKAAADEAGLNAYAADIADAADLTDDIEIEKIDRSRIESYFSDGLDELSKELDAGKAEAAGLAEAVADSAAKAGSDTESPDTAETGGEPKPAVIADDMVDLSRLFGTDKADQDGENDIDAEPEIDEDDGKKKKKKSVGREILSWVITFVAAFLVAIIINAYFFRISKVSGNSMLKSYTDGQTVYITRLPYIFSEPKRGDVVVFDRDQTHRNFFVEIKESFQYNIISLKITKKNVDHKYWIKRVIGVPGDTVEIKSDGVYVNGERLEEDYVNPDEEPRYTPQAAVKVGEGELFVMGDNRNHSSDSRVIGVITINSVLGKVIGS